MSSSLQLTYHNICTFLFNIYCTYLSITLYVKKAPPNFPEIVEKWESGIIKSYEAAEMCGMCESTFYHRLREYRATLNGEK